MTARHAQGAQLTKGDYSDAMAFAQSAAPTTAEQSKEERQERVVAVARELLNYNGVSNDNLHGYVIPYARRCDPPWGESSVEKICRAAIIRRDRERAARAEPPKKPERFPHKVGSWAVIATQLEISSRRVQFIAVNGVASREYAEKLAPLFGCNPEDLITPAGRRGRRATYQGVIMRAGTAEFNFKKFATDTFAEMDPRRERDWDFFWAVGIAYEKRRAPAEFKSLEAFITFSRAEQLPGADSVRKLVTVWKQYKLWVGDSIHERYTESVEAEEPDDEEHRFRR